MSAPTARDFGELLWLVAEWEARHEGYSAPEPILQDAIARVIPESDRPALAEANRYPYLYQPTPERIAEVKTDWARVHAGAVA